MSPSLIEVIAAVLFGLAILHTFATKFFEHLAHTRPAHAGVWHLLGEVEVVFGFWALVLVAVMFALLGKQETIAYVESRHFTEPLFVFVIMVIAATRPILSTSTALVRHIARLLPLPGSTGVYLVVMSVLPLLGSFITEPAAMTLAALMLAEGFFARGISQRLKYATLGVLFVNISIGGTLTAYAAPPVLMVAAKWNWDTGFMLTTFGWKAALAVAVNAAAVTWLFRHELARLGAGEVARGAVASHEAGPANAKQKQAPVPALLALVHVAFLAGVVVFAHHPALFMGLFLVFLAVVQAYRAHQDKLILREGLLVACFLAGLVVLGGLQRWWLQPLLMGMSTQAVFYGATILTAFTDNAALTYLGSLVEGLSPEFQYALVAGAVTGGGLTIIANAPNPAGIAILRTYFDEQTVHPAWLALAALAPTGVAALAFRLL